jgi:serine/threonine-protein kinase RIO1
LLKESSKYRVRRVGEWVIKESRFQGGVGLIRHTFNRQSYRRAWLASWRLAERGVCVPAPVAFVEKGAAGVISGNAFFCAYLEGVQDVRVYLEQMKQRGTSPEEIGAFLNALAAAVNALCGAGAYHSDLAGKNILTRDGRQFYFIDLDAVILDCAYTEDKRLRNHAQLYDAFCHQLDGQTLSSFIERLLPENTSIDSWMPRMLQAHEARAARRARYL